MLERYRHCGEAWRIVGVYFFPHALTGSSSYLVTLIVLFRLLMVTQPLRYESVHEAMSRIGCITIWVLSLLLPAISLITSLPYFYDPNIYSAVIDIAVYGLVTVPILLTVIIYAILLFTVKRKRIEGNRLSHSTSKRMRALAKMTHGIVIGLIVCNVPGLLFMAYFTITMEHGNIDDIFKSVAVV